jgi:NADH-quinone oxidoreductase subunit A
MLVEDYACDSIRGLGLLVRARFFAGAFFWVPLEKTFTSGRRGDEMHGWVPILIMIGLGAGFGAFNIVLSHLVGPKKPTPEKLAPYECGMPPVGDARERHPVKFYLVAMIFLLFDIEVAFLYPFAMALRDLGWVGFVQVLVFFALLVTGYIYVWRKGVLDWGHER